MDNQESCYYMTPIPTRPNQSGDSTLRERLLSSAATGGKSCLITTSDKNTLILFQRKTVLSDNPIKTVINVKKISFGMDCHAFGYILSGFDAF
tara:strand:+ start:1747 stop:2025 length:279 start_codon:yes stop_codon:yes gene_type:complete